MAQKIKLKTNKSAKRRFSITATGKIMHAKGMKSHHRRRKSARVKRQFDRMQLMDKANTTRARRMMPYGD